MVVSFPDFLQIIYTIILVSTRYHEWLEQKKKTDALRHALEIEQQKLKELELCDKKEKSDAAFKSWLEKSFQRAKTIPSSYAKSDGAITGSFIPI